MSQNKPRGVTIAVGQAGRTIDVAWKAEDVTVNFVIDVSTGRVVGGEHLPVNRVDAFALKVILADHGHPDLGKQVWRNYRNAS